MVRITTHFAEYYVHRALIKHFDNSQYWRHFSAVACNKMILQCTAGVL